MRRFLRGVAIVAAVLAATALLWSAIASYFWHSLTGEPDAFPWVTAWWVGLQWFGANWWCVMSTLVSAAVPSVVTVAIWMGAIMAWRWRYRSRRYLNPRWAGEYRQSTEGVTDNHGHSRWATMEEAKRRFSGPDREHGGVAVGEAYRPDQDTTAGVQFDPRDRSTWGMGGLAPLLIDPCTRGSGHSIVVGGPGRYKSASAATSIMIYRGSSVIMDPSVELGPMLDGALRSQGKDVFHIGIFDPDHDGPMMTGFNVLAWINTDHPEADAHVREVVSWIYDDASVVKHGAKQEDPFFAPSGRMLIACLLAHMLWSEDETIEKTLDTFAAGIAVPEQDMLDLLRGINANSSSLMARRLAGALMGCQAEETFSGIYLNAQRGVEWLHSLAYADLISRGAFDPASLLDGNTTVFLNLKLSTLQHTPALAKVIIGALMNALFMDDGKSGRKVLFLIDEASALGKTKYLETARDRGRKYGIALRLLFQSMGQLQEAWGREEASAWIDAIDYISFNSIRAAGYGKDLSEALGSHAVLAHSEGDNEGKQRPFGLSLGTQSRGTNVNLHEIKKSLISAAEMQQDLRDDEQVIIPSSGMPIRCGLPIWFRRPELTQLVENSRFVKTGA